MDKKICQSCGMPMIENNDFGTNKNNSMSEEYCTYCFQKGSFTNKNRTLDEQININIGFAEKMGMEEKEARDLAKSILPNLKRWKRF